MLETAPATPEMRPYLYGAAARQGGGEAEGALGTDAGAGSCVDECALHTNGAEGIDPGIGDARGDDRIAYGSADLFEPQG